MLPLGIILATPPLGFALEAVTPVVEDATGRVLFAGVPDMLVSIVKPLEPPVAVGYRCVRCP